MWQLRHLVFRTHIGPNHPTLFPHRITAQFAFLHKSSGDRCVRNLKAVAFDIEFPAVIDAAESILFIPTVVQIGAAMSAISV